MTPAYNENLERAIGSVLSDHLQKSDRNFQLIEAKVATFLADMRASQAENDAKFVRLMDEVRLSAGDQVSTAIAAFHALPAPKDGVSVTREDVVPLIDDMVSARFAEMGERSLAAIREAFRAIPPVKDGQSVTVEDVTPLLERLVADRVSEIERAASTAVHSAISAIPTPKDGQSVTVDDVAPMISEMAETAKASVLEMIAPEVERAVAELPKPKDGTSVTAGDVAPLIEKLVTEKVAAAGIEDAIQKAVAQIPRPKDGLDGKIDRAEPWADGVHYERQIRTHAGGTWQALRDTASEPPHADWQCLSAPGAQGPTLEVKGAFSAGVEYRAHDVVLVNGSSFVATKDAPGDCPGAGWKLLASAGGRGKQGDAGKPGAPGKPGRDGLELAAFHLEGSRVVLTLSDGAQHSVDLAPLMAITQ